MTEENSAVILVIPPLMNELPPKRLQMEFKFWEDSSASVQILHPAVGDVLRLPRCKQSQPACPKIDIYYLAAIELLLLLQTDCIKHINGAH